MSDVRPTERKGHAAMTTATLVRPETQTVTESTQERTARIMAANRATVPHITCTACGAYTARSNTHADSVCDQCIDTVHPAHALYATHGVSWKVGG